MFSIKPMLDFEASFGGSAVTLVRVSRIETREGVIGFPVSVTSQNRRFYFDNVSVFMSLEKDWMYIPLRH